MAHNDAYYGMLKISYSFSSFTHVARQPIRAADPDSFTTGASLSSIQVFQRDGGAAKTLDTAIGEYLALLEDLYGSGTTVLAPEVWGRQSLSNDFGWINTYSAGETGVAAGAGVLMLQTVMSFRTAGGNIMRPTFMEAAGYAVNVVDPAPFGVAAYQAMAEYYTSIAGSWLVGRDDNWAVAPLNLTTKTNDALRRKRALLGA